MTTPGGYPEPDHTSNRVFFIRFGIVVSVLHVVTFALILVARSVGAHEQDQEVMRAALVERIKPIGRVITSQEELIARSEPTPAGATLTAAQVVTQYCAACHDAGVLGAPRSGDTATWKARETAAGGMDGLLGAAIAGKGAMPPRGGAPVSDEVLREAIVLLMQPLTASGEAGAQPGG
jgi:cytochrome c5